MKAARIFLKITASIVVLFCLLAGPYFAPGAQALSSDWYVSTGGADSNDCQTPGTACRTIQAAINKASSGIVHVAAGTYNENIVMKSGVSVTGESPSTTTIMGTASVNGTVLFSDVSNTKLSGFKITVGTPVPGTDNGVVFDLFTSNATLENNVITGVQYGIKVWSPSTPLIQNNTLIADSDEQGIYIGNSATAPTIRNNIITGYSFAGIHVVAGTAAPTPIMGYNDLWNNSSNYQSYPDQTGLNGNISANPLYANPASGNFHLTSCSPAIDAGDPASAYSNEPAPNGGQIDMGAYGNTSEATSFSCSSGVTLPFVDDFSTAKEWIDASSGNIHRDAANNWLSWKAQRDQAQRYYIPLLGAPIERVQLSFRFNVTDAAGNGGIWVGLAESLDAPGTIWASDATGVFVGLNDDTAYGNKIPFLAMYGDGTFDGVDSQASTINYGSQNVWRRLTMTVDHTAWKVVVTDDYGALVGQMAGTLSQQHSAYNYLMVFFDYTPGWEYETGYLDDIEVSSPEPLPFTDDFSTGKSWIDASKGNIYRDAGNNQLNWRAQRDQSQRYYIPLLNAPANQIQLKFRFNVTAAAGNGGIWVGLGESLDAPGTIWASDATGVFVGLNDDTAYGNKIPFLATYSNGTFDGVDSQASTINYGSQNVWRRLTLTVVNSTWAVVVTDDAGYPIGQMTGILSNHHSSYNYLILLFDYTPGWEYETGWLDDVQVSVPAVSQATLLSNGQADGTVLESGETSGTGGSVDAAGTTFSVGDDALDRQYRAILSFNTAGIPGNAIIASVTLKVKKQSSVGTLPFTTHKGLRFDIRKPYFGASQGLVAGDFQAAASKSLAGIFGSTASGGWYSASINPTVFRFINRTGATQFRLRFYKDDNDDRGADIIRFYSGNASTASRPILIVTYYIP